MNKKSTSLMISKFLAATIIATTVGQLCTPHAAYAKQLNAVNNSIAYGDGTSEVNAEDTEKVSYDFSKMNLKDLKGKKVSLNDYNGKNVIVLFWNIDHKKSRERAKEIEKLYLEQDDKKFEMLVVNVGNSKREVKRFLRKTGYKFNVLMDESKELNKIFNVSSYPEIVIVDDKGNEIKRETGMEGYDEIRSFVNEKKKDEFKNTTKDEKENDKPKETTKDEKENDKPKEVKKDQKENDKLKEVKKDENKNDKVKESTKDEKSKNALGDYNEKVNFKAKDINGKDVSLSDYKGKKVYLTYWIDICGENKKHLERLNKLYNAAKGKDDVEILFVTYRSYKPEELKDLGYDFPIILDNYKSNIDFSEKCPWVLEIAEKLNVKGMGVPDSYMIDEKGNIVKHFTGTMNISQMKEFTSIKTQDLKLVYSDLLEKAKDFVGIKTEVEGEVKDSYNEKTNFTVKDSNGKTVKLDDYSGKKVFLTYWYPWKENIQKHLENVNKIYKSLGDRKDINILTVTFGGFEYANNYAKDEGYKFPILMDNTLKGIDVYGNFREDLRKNYLIASKFGIKNIDNPSSYLIDENGKIIKSADKEMSVDELKDFMGVKDLNVVEDDKEKDTYNKNNRFTAKTVEGKEVSLKDFKGKKVFLTYFYPHYDNVEKHLEYVNELYNRLNRKDIEILTVTWHYGGDKTYLKDEQGLDVPVLVDIGGWYPHQQHRYTDIICGKYKVDHTLYPSSYLIDENGNIAKEHHDRFDGSFDLNGLMKFIGISEKDLKDKDTYKSRKKPKPVHIPGDADCNGVLDDKDLREVKYVAGLRKNDIYTYDTFSLLIKDMDMNADGIVDDTDVELLQKAIKDGKKKK